MNNITKNSIEIVPQIVCSDWEENSKTNSSSSPINQIVNQALPLNSLSHSNELSLKKRKTSKENMEFNKKQKFSENDSSELLFNYSDVPNEINSHIINYIINPKKNFLKSDLRFKRDFDSLMNLSLTSKNERALVKSIFIAKINQENNARALGFRSIGHMSHFLGIKCNEKIQFLQIKSDSTEMNEKEEVSKTDEEELSNGDQEEINAFLNITFPSLKTVSIDFTFLKNEIQKAIIQSIKKYPLLEFLDIQGDFSCMASLEEEKKELLRKINLTSLNSDNIGQFLELLDKPLNKLEALDLNFEKIQIDEQNLILEKISALYPSLASLTIRTPYSAPLSFEKFSQLEYLCVIGRNVEVILPKNLKYGYFYDVNLTKSKSVKLKNLLLKNSNCDFSVFDFSNIECLTLIDSDFDDIDFLFQMTKLKKLKLVNCSIEKGISEIGQLKNLNELLIHECTGDDFQFLSKLKNLRKLSIKNHSYISLYSKKREITFKDHFHLNNQLPQLRILNLYDFGLPSSNFLKNFPNLETLKLDHTLIKSTHPEDFSCLKNLIVNFPEARLNVSGFKEIKNLEVLQLNCLELDN